MILAFVVVKTIGSTGSEEDASDSQHALHRPAPGHQKCTLVCGERTMARGHGQVECGMRP